MPDQVGELAALIGRRLGGGRGLLDQRAVTLGHLVHVADGGVHLVEAGRLLAARCRDLGDDVADLLDRGDDLGQCAAGDRKSTRELQSLMRTSSAVFCLTKKKMTTR